MNACGEFVNGCRLAKQVRKAERVEARAQRKEAKLVNKAAKAAMHGNAVKATKLQMRANELHSQAEFANQTRQGALTVMAESSVPMVQKLGSYVAQPRRCCGRFQAAPLKTQTVVIGGMPVVPGNGMMVVPSNGVKVIQGNGVTVVPGNGMTVVPGNGMTVIPGNGMTVVPGFMPNTVITEKAAEPAMAFYPNGPVAYPPQQNPVGMAPPAYVATPGGDTANTRPPAYTQ